MRIATLLSGGVDSSVAVHLLKEAGYTPDLFYIKIGSNDDDELHCTSEEDIEMATLIAHKYGCKLEIVDLHRDYWDNVVAYTIDKVRKGLTPNPDVMCNKLIKFGVFEQRVGHAYDKTATGHYATITERDGKVYLSTAKDPLKDQTDFLAQLDNLQVSKLMFPVGHLMKDEVRRIAAEASLPSAKRHDSQGICFLGKINYNDFIARYLGEKEGPIVEVETGRILGTHRGYWFHTVGQRKGLGIALGKPAFVLRLNAAKNTVMLGDAGQLEVTDMLVGQMQMADEALLADERLSVRIRYRSAPLPCSVRRVANLFPEEVEGDECLLVHFKTPASAVTPGQSAVFYVGEKMVGGAYIASQKGLQAYLQPS